MEVSSISPTLEKLRENKEKKCEISKFRNYASQIYAAFATSIVKLSAGGFVGFSTVMIAELYKENSEIDISISELTVFSSYCFAAPIGCLFVGMLSQWIGNRAAMLISVTFFVVSVFLFYFATNATMLLTAQTISGFFGMISFGPGITYVVEITQPQLRSILTASSTLSMMSSAFLIVLLSNFLYWRQLVFVMLGFGIIGFLAVCTIPESPYWLASKNKLDEAEAALSWLRGWSSSENVKTEFNALKKMYTHNLVFPTKQGKIDSSRMSVFKDRIKNYLHRSFYIPLSLSCLLFILQHCLGYSPMNAYCIVIFKRINAPINAKVAASIFDAMRILGALVCILIIHRTGKKKLMYFSLIGAGLCFLTSSSALTLKAYQIYPDTCQWIATISMILTAFMTSVGIDKVVYILNAELFPTKYRHVGAGIGLFVATVCGAVMNKMFISMMNTITVAGVFAFFGISAVVACVVFHFLFPETEGKSLQEIQAHYDDADVESMEIHEKTDKMQSTDASAV